MGKRVSPPPLYELDYVSPDSPGGGGGGGSGGGDGPYYPEEKDYDYDAGKPWYIVKHPLVERKDETFGLDKERFWFNKITPKCDVLLRNFDSYLALHLEPGRYIFDEEGTIICDYKSVNVNMSTCELKTPITLKEGVSYYFPIGNENFTDEKHNINYVGSKFKLKDECLPDIAKDKQCYIYSYDADDFKDFETGEFLKVGDVFNCQVNIPVETTDIYYMGINKRIVLPDLH